MCAEDRHQLDDVPVLLAGGECKGQQSAYSVEKNSSFKAEFFNRIGQEWKLPVTFQFDDSSSICACMP
jgi:hypothetical protein